MLAQQRLRAGLDVCVCIAGFITKVLLFAIAIERFHQIETKQQQLIIYELNL